MIIIFVISPFWRTPCQIFWLLLICFHYFCNNHNYFWDSTFLWSRAPGQVWYYDVTWLIYVWRVPSMCVTCLLHVCSMVHSHRLTLIWLVSFYYYVIICLIRGSYLIIIHICIYIYMHVYIYVRIMFAKFLRGRHQQTANMYIYVHMYIYIYV